MNNKQSQPKKTKRWTMLTITLGIVFLLIVAVTVYVVKNDQKTSFADQDTTIQNRDLKTFCEKMASGELRSGAGRPGGAGGGDRFEQIQGLMVEMQSLCMDNVYTGEEIAMFNELQSQMPERSAGGFNR